MVSVEFDGSQNLIGLAKDYKSELISTIYGLLNHYKIPEKFELENEISDINYLIKILKKDYYSFEMLISRKMSNLSNLKKNLLGHQKHSLLNGSIIVFFFKLNCLDLCILTKKLSFPFII